MNHDRLTPEALQKLRDSRVRPARDLTLAKPMGDLAKMLRARMAHAAAGTAFLKAAPKEIAAFTTVVGVRAGVLQLAPHTAAKRYELDRWLRSGGEKAVLQAAPQGVVRIRLV